jgi:hypothetical protein
MERRRQEGSSLPISPDCELVPIEEVAQAIDWLHSNGIAGGGC